MEYPVVAVTKQGHPYLLFSESKAIHASTEDGLIEFAVEVPTNLKRLKFPVKAFANHLAAGTVHNPYEAAVINELQTCYENYLMPVYLTKAQVQEYLNAEERPGSADSFFPFWAPPKLKQESEDMATKKAAPKAASKKAAAPKVKAAPKTAKAPKAEGTKKRGIGAFCKELIVKGKTNDEIMEAVAKEFPDANTTKGSIAFYRNAVKAGK